MLSASRFQSALRLRLKCCCPPLVTLLSPCTVALRAASVSTTSPQLRCWSPRSHRFFSTASSFLPGGEKAESDSAADDQSVMSAHRPVTASHHSVVPAPSHPSAVSPAVAFSSVVFLGTGAAVPSTVRNTAALCVVLSNGSSLLLDCGEGTQQQLMRCTSVKLGRIDGILITHLHGDHCFGLPGLLCTLGTCGRTAPLTIVGPPALRSMLEAMLSGAGGFDAFPLHFLPLQEGLEHDCGLIAGVHVTAAPLLHTIPAFAYTLREATKAGPLLVDQARAMGVSGKQLGRLKAGHDVTNERGETVRAADCVGPSPSPLRISLVQDTYDCTAAYSQLRDVDVLIHECTYDASLADKAVQHGHSTAAQAGKVAAEVDARMLILTHFSARYGLGVRNRSELLTRHQATQQGADATDSPAQPHPQSPQPASQHNEAAAEERKDEAAAAPSAAAAAGITADELVQEAMDAYVMAKGGDASSCITVCAAEDFLLFERHGSEFHLKGYDRTASKVPPANSELAG